MAKKNGRRSSLHFGGSFAAFARKVGGKLQKASASEQNSNIESQEDESGLTTRL
jgi:hypothetical protein